MRRNGWSRPHPDRDEDAALRPHSFEEFVGQRKIAENMAVYVQAARKRGDALDHVLLTGPPGLGKTTLAFLLAREMGTEIRVTSGPALERKGDLAGILTSLGRGDVLFIDEIHRLQPVVEESLYPAMEDFRIELVTGVGAGAAAIPLSIERFTLVGATTRTGLLGSPLLSRFGIVETFDFYSADELTCDRPPLGAPPRHPHRGRAAPRRSAGAPAARPHRQPAAAADPRLRRRSRRRPHHPRIGRVRDGAPGGRPAGLDAGDRKLLSTVIKRFDGGPVGIDSLAASLAERSRHAGVRLRALPHSGRFPDPDAARPPSHAPRLRAPGSAFAGSRPGESILIGTLRGSRAPRDGLAWAKPKLPRRDFSRDPFNARAGRRGRRCPRRPCGPVRACGRRSSLRPR